jgi:hypothetical protein
MRPDVKKEKRAGWIALSAALVVGALVVMWFSQDDGLSEQLDQVRSAHAAMTGPEPFAQRIAKQQEANEALSRTIEELKRGSGFTAARDFRIEAEDIRKGFNPGYIFKDRFTGVRQKLNDIAAQKHIEYKEDNLNFGFGSDEKVPPDRDAPDLLIMLQLTEKAALIAFNTRTPIVKFNITHGTKKVTGPAGRPPLVREYPLTMEVTATLEDVLWILHALSQVKEPEAGKPSEDYPLVLQDLQISAMNLTEKDEIQVVQAVFKIYGMQFLPPQERGKQGGAKGLTPAATRVPNATASRGNDSTRARP